MLRTGSVVAVVVALCLSCKSELPVQESGEPDVITIVEHIWHTTIEHIWHTDTVTTTVYETITIREEDTTPDVVTVYEYPSGPVPCLVLTEEGVPAMADGPVSGLTAATQINDADLLLITQSGTSKKATADLVPLPLNYIAGLITEQDSGDPDADVKINTGVARDDGDAANLVLSTAIVKQIDAAWAVGTNQGGMDTGAVAADTLYAIWLIRRSDTGLVDALFSLSFTSPTMPTNYDQKRLIGAVLTDLSSDIIVYTQTGDEFAYIGNASHPPPIGSDSTITANTWEQYTLPVPPHCRAHLSAQLLNTTETADQGGFTIRTPAASSWSFGSQRYWASIDMGGTTFDGHASSGSVLVDSSSQMEAACTEVAGTATFSWVTWGFTMLTRRDPK